MSNQNNWNPFMGVPTYGDISTANEDTDLVTDKDIYGNTVTQSLIWFAIQRQTAADYPKMVNVAGGALLNEYVTKLVATGQPLSVGQHFFLATKYKVDQSVFALRSGGGGGISAADRRNKVQTLTARIQNDSAKLGIKLSNDEIAYMATAAEKLNFSEDQLSDMILTQIDWTEMQGGTLTASRDEVKAMGKKYLMNLSDLTAQDYAKRIASGEMDVNAIGSILSAQARTSMPWIAQYLDQGLTPEDVLTAPRDQIAQGLEINAKDIDITNDKYLKMMTVQDEKLGTRLATQSEIQKNIRTDERWGQTRQAKQIGSSMAATIAQIFGKSSF